MGEPGPGGVWAPFCGDSGGVASDGAAEKSALVDDGESGDAAVGICGSVGACRGRPALASSRRLRTWGRGTGGEEEVRRSGGGQEEVRSAAGLVLFWVHAAGGCRFCRISFEARVGAHQLLRLRGREPVEEELIELELGRRKPVDVVHLVAWARRRGRGRGQRAGRSLPRKTKRKIGRRQLGVARGRALEGRRGCAGGAAEQAGRELHSVDNLACKCGWRENRIITHAADGDGICGCGEGRRQQARWW